MAASSKLMVTEAERCFPVRLRVALPAGGFGTRLTAIHDWLDQERGCGRLGDDSEPDARPGHNDAVAVYFAHAMACFRCARMSQRRGG